MFPPLKVCCIVLTELISAVLKGQLYCLYHTRRSTQFGGSPGLPERSSDLQVVQIWDSSWSANKCTGKVCQGFREIF